MIAFSSGEPADGRLDCVWKRETALHVQYGSVSRFDIPHSFRRRVRRELVGDALDRRRRLHYRERRLKALEVVLEVPRIGDLHVVGQASSVAARHRNAMLRAKLDQRLRTNGAVEVTMQLRFRKPPQDLPRHRGLIAWWLRHSGRGEG